jgi:hypothetical protein
MDEPSEHQCNNCGLCLWLGSYHGGDDECTWIHGVYCRHCGAPHYIENPISTVFSTTPRKEGTPVVFSLRGPRCVQEFICDDISQTELSCQECGATGPYGTAGPLTDEWPGSRLATPQLSADETSAQVNPELAESSQDDPLSAPVECPRCKSKAMHFIGNFIT